MVIVRVLVVLVVLLEKAARDLLHLQITKKKNHLTELLLAADESAKTTQVSNSCKIN